MNKIKWPSERDEIMNSAARQYEKDGQVKIYGRDKHGNRISWWRLKGDCVLVGNEWREKCDIK